MTSGTGRPREQRSTLTLVRRTDLLALAVALPVTLGLITGVPVAVLQAQGEQVTRGPAWLWWMLLVGFLVAFTLAEFLSDHPRRLLAVGSFVVQAVLGVAVILLIGQGVGFANVILVFGAALSCQVLPRWATAVLVAVNTIIAGFATSSAGGWLEPALTALFYLFIQIVSVASVISWQRQQAVSQDLAEAHVQLSATSALLADSTRSAERLRIARDLHDVAGHQLTALALELEVAAHRAEPPAQEHVIRARNIATDLLDNVRDVVSDLRDDSGDLRQTLERVVAAVPAPAVHLSVGEDVVADEARTTALVRAVQEIAANTIRHAREAENLWIELTRENGNLVLSAADDGWGATDFALGNGLRGIRERAEQLGGTARFLRSSSTRGGFATRLEVPAS